VGNSRLGGSAATGEETEISLRLLEWCEAVVRVMRKREREREREKIILSLLLLFTYTTR